MTTSISRIHLARSCTILLVLVACAADTNHRMLPPAAVGFRAYAAAKLGIAESEVDGGPTNEEEAALFTQRVGTLWAMTMFPRGDTQNEVRGWATPGGVVVAIDQNLGLLLEEAGVWGGGVVTPLTATQLG
jgi:hypothetical protein